MFFHKLSQEEQLLQQKKKSEELFIQMEALDKEVSQLLAELKITPEQVSIYLSNPDNFTRENWEELKKQRNILDEKLQKELNQIRNPLKMKQKYFERNNARYWIPVR